MKRLVPIAVLLAPFICAAGKVCAEPYAPKLEVPAAKLAKGPPNDAAVLRSAVHTRKALNELKVPNRAAVPVPPYPGAKVYSAELGYWSFGDESPEPKFRTPRCLPNINLYSTDSVDKVLAFYQRELEGYQFATLRIKPGTDLYQFWVGHKYLDRTDGEAMCAVPHVEIVFGSPPVPFWPEAQTTIEIGYIPR